MAKPTTNPAWATDATYDADASDNKIEPPSILREEGWERAEEPGAQHLNHVLNAHGAHLEYIHSILEADGVESIPSVTRSLVLSASVLTPARDGGDPLIPEWVAGAWQLTSDNQALVMALNKYVPFGAQLVGADLLMSASSKSTPGRLGLYLVESDYDTPVWDAAVEIATADTSGPGPQVLTVGAWLLDDPNQPLHLRYDSGAFSDASVDDIAAVRLRFVDPGPRNF